MWWLVFIAAALIAVFWRPAPAVDLAGWLILLIVPVLYYIICRLAPRTRHRGFRGCNGTGEARSKLFPWAYHRCDGCNGTGRQIRYGARYIGPEYARNEWTNMRATRQSRHQNHVWR
jgi:hypothetical protein